MKKWTDAQIRAIEINKGDIVVSASAGSGKTTVMIERALRKIMDGTPVNRLLIVTFTRAAAADMRQKLQKALLKALDDALLLKHLSLAEFLRKQITLLPTANITTLSSFCHSLVKSYFFEAGVGADIDIMEDSQAESIAGDILNEMLAHYFEQGDQEIIEILEQLSTNRDDQYLKKKIHSIYKCAFKEADIEGWFMRAVDIYDDPSPLIRYNSKKIEDELNEFKDALLDCVNTARQNGFNDCASIIQGFLQNKDLLTRSRVLELTSPDPLEIEFFHQSIVPLIDGLNLLIKKNQSLFDISEASKPKEFALKLLQFAKDFSLRFLQRKHELNLFEHNDLEHFAHKILLKYGDAIADGFDFVFVDEYQDISPLQDSIISLLCRNNSFFVGDVKQSIYGFRLCKPQIFLQKFRSLSRANAILLNNNYRSKLSILNFCNAVFDGLMTESFGQVDYKAHARLEAGLESQSQDCSHVTCYLIEKPQSSKKQRKSVYSIEDNTVVEPNPEATLIAQKIKQLLSERFFDGTVVRNYRHNDFAILLRARTEMKGYHEALSLEEIPSEYESKKTDFGDNSPEIATLINLLKLIDNFRQDIPLLAVLKSPILALSDDEIFLIKSHKRDCEFLHQSVLSLVAGGGTCQNDSCTQSLITRLVGLFNDLKRWHELSLFKNVSDLMSIIIKETDYFGHIIKQKNGAQKTQNLENWLSLISGAGYPKMLPIFLQSLSHNNPFSAPKSALNEDSDSVKIMTIHQSKGLEFPVVFLAGANKSLVLTKEDKLSGVVVDSDFGLGVKLVSEDDNKSFVSSSLLFKQHEREREEELRLLYVALTRARQQLFVVASNVDSDKLEQLDPKSKKAKSYLQWLKNGFDLATVVNVDPKDLKTQGGERQTAFNAVCDEDFNSRLRAITEFVYPHPLDSVLKTTVTKLNHQSMDEIIEMPKDYSLLDDGSALIRGNAYHKLLEKWDFSAPSLEAEFLRAAQSASLTKQEVAQIDLTKMRHLMSNPFFMGLSGKKLLREKKFILNSSHNNSEPLLIQGIIDLIIIDDEGAIVLDYKTTRGDKHKLISLYSKQLELYKQAVEQILGIKVKAALIYSFDRNEIIEVF